VNGIRAAEKKGFLSWMAATGADVIAVQETKASPEQVSADLRDPAGYVSNWAVAEKAGYSGVATFSRQAPLEVWRGLDDPRSDHEGRVLATRFPELIFLNIYFPSGNRGPEWVAHKITFYQRFVEKVGALISAGERVVVAGDVNTAYAPIDLARPRENVRTSGFMPEERTAMSAFFDVGLVDSFRALYPDTVRYSWWSNRSGARERNIGWRLDYALISENLRPALLGAAIHCEIMGSDHCPVSVTLDV
jgi:exodeoxyribonuclease-3